MYRKYLATSCAAPPIFKEVRVPRRFCAAIHRVRLSLLTFFGEAKKVSGRRATPGKTHHRTVLTKLKIDTQQRK
jgi:hypothetical protein